MAAEGWTSVDKWAKRSGFAAALGDLLGVSGPWKRQTPSAGPNTVNESRIDGQAPVPTPQSPRDVYRSRFFYRIVTTLRVSDVDLRHRRIKVRNGKRRLVTCIGR